MDTSGVFDALCNANASLSHQVAVDATASEELLKEIDDLVVRLRLAGRHIKDDAQRNTLDEYLRTWGSYLYNHRGSRCPFAGIMPYAGDMTDSVLNPKLDSSTVAEAGHTVSFQGPVDGPVHSGTGDIRVDTLQYNYIVQIVDDGYLPQKLYQ